MNIVLLSHHTETHALTECCDDSVLVNYEKSFIMNETTGARHCIAIGEGRWKMSWPPIRESLRADIELTVIKEGPTSMESLQRIHRRHHQRIQPTIVDSHNYLRHLPCI